jgi:hypothetical protein
MERNGRRATALAAFLATPVPLTSRQEEDRYWCEPVSVGVHRLAGRASVYEIDRFGGDEDWGDIGWCCADQRSGH